MKYVSFSFFLAIGFGFYSCADGTAGNIPANSGSQSSKQDSKSTGNNPDNQISFNVNSDPVVSSGWNISRSLINNQLVLNITSNMHEEHRTINLNINGDKPGKYKFSGTGDYNKTGYAYGSYFSNIEEDLANAYHFENGEFIITSIDTVKGILNAGFSGLVKSGKGETLTITDGKITSGKLRLGIAKY